MSASANVTDAMVHAFEDAYCKNWEAQRCAPEGTQELGTFFATRAGLSAALSAQPSPGGQHSAWMLPDDARIVGVIADNIERGKLDHPGFYRNTQLAEVLRRVLSAALSAQPSPGGQDALLASLVARWRKDADEVGASDNTMCQKIANCTMRHAAELQAVIAARQPVCATVKDSLTVGGGQAVAEIFAAFRPDGSIAGTAFSAEEAGYWQGCKVVRYTTPPAQAVDLERARNEGHDGAIRYVLGYLCGMGDWGSTQYVEILNGCGRESIIRSAIEDGELEFTGLGRWVAERGTDEERALIASLAVGP